jgi:hypothetical protein
MGIIQDAFAAVVDLEIGKLVMIHGWNMPVGSQNVLS